MENYERAFHLISALQAETQPVEGHTDPKAIDDCWKELRELVLELKVGGLKFGDLLDIQEGLRLAEGAVAKSLIEMLKYNDPQSMRIREHLEQEMARVNSARGKISEFINRYSY